jgi:hypothetical protein
VWHENHETGGPWRGATELLCIEPSTVPHSLGLAAAVAHGQARTIRPGEVAEPWIVARPFISARPVTAVDGCARIAG